MEFYRESHRLLSFSSWPHSFLKEDLARYGFYYLSVGDFVKCVFCEIEFSEFDENDDVLSDHYNWSPECPFLKGGDVGNIPLQTQPVEMLIINQLVYKDQNQPIQNEESNSASVQIHSSECKVCYANEIQTVFIPCLHACCCLYCTDRINTCIVCRTPIVGHLQIHIC